MEASFVIDTLKYLYKGGRCSGVAALGANVLKLKPCIEVVNGKMEVGKKYRGTLDKVIGQYVDDRLNARDDIDYRRIFITHTPVPEQVLNIVRSKWNLSENLTRSSTPTPAAPFPVTAAPARWASCFTENRAVRSDPGGVVSAV